MKNMTNLKIAFALLFSAALLQACASTDADKRIDSRVAQEPQIRTRKDLDSHINDIFKNTPGLTGQQRDGLVSLKKTMQDKLRQNREEGYKVRELLVTEALSSRPRRSEIQAAEDRLRKLSQQHIEIIFGAVHQANDLLGRSALIREAMDLQMLEDEENNSNF